MNREFLQTTPVSDVMQNSGELQTVRSSDKLAHALQLLVKNRITSLPVWDETANRHRAFIDMLDILTFALKILSESDLKQGKASGYFTFLEAHDKFKSALVGDAVNLSERDLYLQVMETADLETAIRAMLDFGDLHRLPITSKEGNFRLVGLLTQSQLVRWLAGNIERFPLVKDKTIAQIEKFTK
jgi:CBS domain-containing protein